MQIPIPFVAGLAIGGLGLFFARSVRSVYLLALPGLIGHELAHFLIAWVLCAEPRPIKLYPVKDEDGGWTLGSVDFTPAWWSAGAIAIAPLYLLVPVIYLLFHLAYRWTLGWQLAAGYLAAVLTWNALPSGKDWGIAIRYPIGTIFLLGGALLVFLQVLHGKG